MVTVIEPFDEVMSEMVPPPPPPAVFKSVVGPVGLVTVIELSLDVILWMADRPAAQRSRVRQSTSMSWALLDPFRGRNNREKAISRCRG